MRPPRPPAAPSLGASLVLLLVIGLAIGLVVGLGGSPAGSAQPTAAAGTVERTAQGAAEDAANPLAAQPWGSYRGPAEMAWQPYVDASGRRKQTLAAIALRPKAKWFGAWIPTRDIGAKVREYVANAQDGDPDALVQLTVFRMVPWEHDACARLPTRAEKRDYRRWTDRFARALGDTRAALVLQPDGPFALCAPGGSRVPSRLVAYAAKVYGALENTAVYIDAGAADWPSAGQGGVDEAVKILVRGGVRHARGIALNSTHYSDTALEVRRGAAIVEELAERGIADKHVVVNTSSNGQPFLFGEYDGPDPDNARTCRSRTDPRRCVALGIPPTADVDSTRWGLSRDERRLAREHVDAYLWFGRPWLYRQNQPFEMKRALAVVRSSPYAWRGWSG